MASNFTTPVIYNKQQLLAVVVPLLRKDGMHYEVNITGFPRFFMKWSELDRFDIIGTNTAKIPDELLLALSDIIEQKEH